MLSANFSASTQTTSPWARLRNALKKHGGTGMAVVLILFLPGMEAGVPGTQNAAFAPVGSDKDPTAIQASHFVLPPDGEQIYKTRCLSCHQMNGQGVPNTFPPLRDTRWVNGDKGRLIRIILNGLTGSIDVKGKTYRGAMPPWGSSLSDKQVAALSTYLRSNFKNDASPVSPEEVAKVRAATKSRSQPWTAQELKQETHQGIPSDSTAAE